MMAAAKRTITGLGLCALAAIFAGCDRDHIEVTVEPRADGSFQRTVRIWRTGGKNGTASRPPSQELVQHAKTHYKQSGEAKEGVVQFQGVFRSPPADLRRGDEINRGGYSVWTTSLGHAAYYRERRPGSTDFDAHREKLNEKIGLWVKFLSTLMRQQLAGEKGVEGLVKFIETGLRGDLRDLAQFVYSAGLASAFLTKGEDDSEERLKAIAAFALQLAEERDYISVEDVPKFADDESRSELVMGFIAKKMGRPLDDKLREKLAFVHDEERLKAVVSKTLAAMGMTEKELKDANEELRDQLFRIDLFGSNAELSYVLLLPPSAEGLHTNGHRDGEAREITWKDTLAEGPSACVYFALWAVADAEWQKKHFGRTALRGDELIEYISWEHSLPPEKAKKWRAALNSLDPKGDLTKQLSAIQLAPHPPDDPPETVEGARLIQQALGAQDGGGATRQ